MLDKRFSGMLCGLLFLGCCPHVSKIAALAKPSPEVAFQVMATPLTPKEYRHQFPLLNQTHPYFEVRCKVTNVSKTSQTIETMNCSWNQNWRTSDKRIFCLGWDCAKNIQVHIKLAPGKSYEKILPLSAMTQAQGKTIAFRIGFTPQILFRKPHKSSVIWSAPVTLSVPK